VEELAARLTKRSRTALSTDEAMRAKTVVVLGEEHATPAQIAAAVAVIFGARVVDNKEKGTVITRRRYPLPRDMGELPAYVINCVPAPLLRAIHYSATAPTRPDRNEENVGGTMRANLSQKRKWDQRFRLLPAALRSEAARQLFSLTEARLNDKNGKLPVPDLEDAEKNLLAAALMGRLLSSITTNLNAAPPRYITDFDTLNLQGRIEQKNGVRELSVYFAVPAPGKAFEPGSGVVGGASTVLEKD
jgi:hypothetical protein